MIALSGRSRARRDSLTDMGYGLLFVPREVNLGDMEARSVIDGVAAGSVPWPVLAWFPLLAAWPDAGQQALLRDQALMYVGLPKQVGEYLELLRGYTANI